MAEIVIIGAGLTGLSAAYHLEKLGFTDYKLFEKESEVGGLCRSVYQDGFTFDYTGHLLHINDDYFKKFIDTVVGFENFNTISRRSFIYSQGIYTHFPFQVNLFGLPPATIAECIEGFITRPQTKKVPKDFKRWVLANFGKGIAEHFFYPYQEKIFSYPLEKLSSSWTGRFVPKTSLTEMLTGALQPPQEQHIGYNAQFFYPKKDGIFFWVKKLYEQLKQPVYLQKTVTKINIKEKKVIFTDGSCQHYTTLINTMPLNTFLTLIKDSSSSNFSRSAKKLLCNSVVNFNLGIKRENLSDKHWIYYPEKKFPFYRIGFSHNFAESMAPQGHSSLYGEFSYLQKPHDEVWQILQTALNQTKKILKIDDSEIATEKIITINHAYVIFDAWRDKNLPLIHQRLTEYNIHSIGRYGRWKYSSMQEALLEGKEIAEKLTFKKFLLHK
ncbi:MAG: NAD(P)-binding protein [Candidatus Babeliaceae bacterium]|nr:NAD(P)-binding protein [Candidatus Babeliaceae bacterium]